MFIYVSYSKTFMPLFDAILTIEIDEKKKMRT